MKFAILKISLIFLFLGLIGEGCKNEDEGKQENVNITLYDQPLSVIQKYITGNWKLQYLTGGIAGSKYVDMHNSYMNLTPDHIILGNDLQGINIDTTIVWKQDLIGINETFLMGVPHPGWPAPMYFIVNEIKNDTLILSDYNISDGYIHYYTKQ